jgi:putative copper export protein
MWSHYLVVLFHISAGLFWMGWIVFMFFLLIPVLRRLVPERLQQIQPALQKRVRKVVFWFILLIVATGLHNIYFTGLYDTRILLDTSYGHRFMVKLGAVLLLFTIYFSAPFLTGMHGRAAGNASCCKDNSRRTQVASLVLHTLAFAAGMTAALIGVSLGG